MGQFFSQTLRIYVCVCVPVPKKTNNSNFQMPRFTFCFILFNGLSSLAIRKYYVDVPLSLAKFILYGSTFCRLFFVVMWTLSSLFVSVSECLRNKETHYTPWSIAICILCGAGFFWCIVWWQFTLFVCYKIVPRTIWVCVCVCVSRWVEKPIEKLCAKNGQASECSPFKVQSLLE